MTLYTTKVLVFCFHFAFTVTVISCGRFKGILLSVILYTHTQRERDTTHTPTSPMRTEPIMRVTVTVLGPVPYEAAPAGYILHRKIHTHNIHTYTHMHAHILYTHIHVHARTHARAQHTDLTVSPLG